MGSLSVQSANTSTALKQPISKNEFLKHRGSIDAKVLGPEIKASYNGQAYVPAEGEEPIPVEAKTDKLK